MSTQEGFGRILADLARIGGPLAERIVTTSPDVTVSTNLGGWVNRRGVFDRHRARRCLQRAEGGVRAALADVAAGQHIELGIAENNLFILLAALGLSHSLFGARLLPIGTLYDPFISAARCAQLCLLPGCAVHAGGDAIGPDAGAGRRRAPIRRHAADRPRRRTVSRRSSRPSSTNWRRSLRWSFDYMQRDGSGPSRPQRMAARRQGRLGLSASVHPHARAAGAQHR